MQEEPAGGVFDEVPELYDRVRPTYPDAMFGDLAAITGVGGSSSALEIGIGTGQATHGLARIVGEVTALEPGLRLATVAGRRLAHLDTVTIETSPFEEWQDRGRRFDIVMAASSWHWIDPLVRWSRAHAVLRTGGWLAVLGHTVVRGQGDVEVYGETADLHERFSPGNPAWGHPPSEDEVRGTDRGWDPQGDPAAWFGAPTVRRYPTLQTFDGNGFADLLRTLSPYRRLEPDVREALLMAIADRIRERMDDRAQRRYLSVLSIGRRIERA